MRRRSSDDLVYGSIEAALIQRPGGLIGTGKRCVAALAMAVVVGSASPANAAPVVYTDLAAFTLATSGLTTIDFEGLADQTDLFTFYPSPPGLTASGVTFEAIGQDALFVIDPGFDPNFNFPSGQFLQNNDFATVAGISAALPAGITAVGADLSAQNPPSSSFNLTVTLQSGGSFSFPFLLDTRPALTFIGFTSDVPISSVEFTGPGAVTIDNFRFGTAAVVPEPASMTLLGLALAGLGARQWRQKRNR